MKRITNLALKIAILESGKSQRQISRATGILENKLSGMLRGRYRPTDLERGVLARVLRRSVDDLFSAGDVA